MQSAEFSGNFFQLITVAVLGVMLVVGNQE
jgi:hypothetical protein